MRRREHVGLTALMDAARLDRPAGAAGISASCSGRASMPAAASAAPISACGCCWRTTRSEAGAHRGRARPAQPRAPGDRAADAWREAEAEAMAALGIEEKGAVVVTAGQGWHPGVVGLVAARLKERFGRPAFAIALEPGGIGTGSGRSITGVDLGARGAPRGRRAGCCSRAAATRWRPASRSRRTSSRAFRAYLEETLARRRSRRRGATTSLLIDGAITAGGANVAMLADIARAGPFGAGQCRAGVRAAVAHDRLCRGGRAGACARAAARRATARCSTRSRSAPPASRSARR